ncbi:Subtilisin-like protease 2 [Hypsizygus marmoreus]|uniref:Subtilisin-like protease 2 n=1 Tax=Hypsizygus marmoreus TaxID=39966 RepID=A0A369JMM7_HYPMA|nr:Subtilisin-like protease 2 [Hypsizygus marmoreus]
MFRSQRIPPSPDSQRFPSKTIFITISFVAPVFVARSRLAPLERFSGKKIGRNVLRFRGSASETAMVGQMNNATTSNNGIHETGLLGNPTRVFFPLLCSSPSVDFIAENGTAEDSLSSHSASAFSSHSASAFAYSYCYDGVAGTGVDIHVIVDTDVYTAHSDIGSQARWEATFGGYADTDGNAHGVHVAGVAAGSCYDVAKAASIIAVKPLVTLDQGRSMTTAASGRPSIASLSLGASTSTALDNAVRALTYLGIHITACSSPVAAGNANTDARSTSSLLVLARSPRPFSNYGPVGDVFGPGHSATRAWIVGAIACRVLLQWLHLMSQA